MNLKKRTLEFDTEKLLKDVRIEGAFGSDSLSLRELADLTGISASTLSRLDNGHKPDLDTVISLCESANLNPGDYFVWIQWSGEIVE